MRRNRKAKNKLVNKSDAHIKDKAKSESDATSNPSTDSNAANTDNASTTSDLTSNQTTTSGVTGSATSGISGAEILTNFTSTTSIGNNTLINVADNNLVVLR
ncbi:hypothetical protein [Brevibacillus nitrificans]|uniref:hypothetical protein n=1 Tax=Brevibacillus nitrificans TaxID=651560 RepID=UPI00285A8E1C|nr:hypothetical protein [Brevibacillus nitrificans]MDR7317279.1 hypothetical protein [Brevibacillus nitrificans]